MIAGSHGKSIFSYVRNCQLSSLGASILHFDQQWSSCCSTALPVFAVISVLDCGHSLDVFMVFYCCFNLNFSDDVWFGASFHVLICHLYIFFVVMSVEVFDPFFNEIVYFLIVEF